MKFNGGSWKNERLPGRKPLNVDSADQLVVGGGGEGFEKLDWSKAGFLFLNNDDKVEELGEQPSAGFLSVASSAERTRFIAFVSGRKPFICLRPSSEKGDVKHDVFLGHISNAYSDAHCIGGGYTEVFGTIFDSDSLMKELDYDAPSDPSVREVIEQRIKGYLNRQ